MKTHNHSDTHLKGLPVQSSKSVVGTKTSGTDTRPRIDMARRQENRQLGTDQLLDLLRSEAPRFYELAEVVGKWVWVQFADKQPATITSQLAEFGFHWNNKRQVWQHPCGPVTMDASPRRSPRQVWQPSSGRLAGRVTNSLPLPLRLDRGEGWGEVSIPHSPLHTMRRTRRPLPIPQHEFGFTADTFTLFSESTLDGERIARERAEADQARRAAQAAQASLFPQPLTDSHHE